MGQLDQLLGDVGQWDDRTPARADPELGGVRVEDHGTEVGLTVDEVARPSSSTNRNRQAVRPVQVRHRGARRAHGPPAAGRPDPRSSR